MCSLTELAFLKIACLRQNISVRLSNLFRRKILHSKYVLKTIATKTNAFNARERKTNTLSFNKISYVKTIFLISLKRIVFIAMEAFYEQEFYATARPMISR